jgi:hypothetical protein
MNVVLWKNLVFTLITLCLSSCGDSIKEQKTHLIKTGIQFLQDPKINQLTKKGEYLFFSEIDKSLSKIHDICKSDLIQNDRDIQFLISISIQEEMFNYPHVIRGRKTYEVVKAANDFPSLYPDISNVFKALASPTSTQKEIYTQHLNRFKNLSDYKKYITFATKKNKDPSLNKNIDIDKLSELNEKNLDYQFKYIAMFSCGMSDVILGMYDYETKSRKIAYEMMNNVSNQTGGFKSKIYTSYDSNGCPVYKNASGKVLQKSMKLRQEDGC